MGIKSWASVEDVTGVFVQMWSRTKGLVAAQKTVVQKKHLYPLPFRDSKHGTYQHVRRDSDSSLDGSHYTSSEEEDVYASEDEQEAHLEYLDLSSEGGIASGAQIIYKRHSKFSSLVLCSL
jgi:hypothetical protein